MPRHYWTVEEARAMGRRSAEFRALRKANPPQPTPLIIPTDGDSSVAPPLEYSAVRLSRVRQQLDRVDMMLLAEKDPQKLERLASASIKLSDQEFALAGRFKPGNLKPSVSQSTKRYVPAVPLGVA